MNHEPLHLDRYFHILQSVEPIKTIGSVKRAVGLVVESQGPPVSVVEHCGIIGLNGSAPVPADVV